MFYGPRLFWVYKEEGKLTTMIKGVLKANKKIEMDEDKKNENENACVNNVINYLHMKEGGHWQYGACYVLSQVRCDANLQVEEIHLHVLFY